MTDSTVSQLAVDGFDRFLQSADGLPGVRKTRPSTIRSTHPLTGVTATHIVQSYRTETGYTVLIERVDAGGHYRYVLPPEISVAIYRQRQSLADRSTPESRAQGAARGTPRTSPGLGRRASQISGLGAPEAPRAPAYNRGPQGSMELTQERGGPKSGSTRTLRPRRGGGHRRAKDARVR